MADPKPVYRAVSKDAAEAKTLDRLEEKWGPASIGEIAQSWRHKMGESVSVLPLSGEDIRSVYTTEYNRIGAPSVREADENWGLSRVKKTVC